MAREQLLDGRSGQEVPMAPEEQGHHVVVTKNITLLVASTTIGKLSAMAVTVVMARVLGAENFGLYAFALALANLLSLIPNYGFNPLVTRDIAKDASQAGQLLGDILVLKFALSAITLLVAIGVLSLTSVTPTRQMVVYLSIGCMLGESFLNFIASFYRAYQVLEYEAVVQVALAIFHTVVGLIILLLGYGLIPFLWWRLAGFVGGAGIAYYLLVDKLVRPAFGLRFVALKEMLWRALPLAVVSLFVATYVRIDMILLALIKGDLATGWYSAAQRPVGVLAFLPAAFVGAILPAMSGLGQTSQSLSRYFEQTTKYLLIISLPLTIGIGLLADRIVLLLYGQAYAPAIAALQILAGTLVVTFVNHGISTALVAVGQERKFMSITGWGVGFNIVTNLACIPLYAHVGASLTTLATEVFVLALGLREIRRGLSDLHLFPVINKPVVAGVAMSAVILGLRGQSTILLVCLSAVSYVCALFLVGGLDRREITLPIRLVVMTLKGAPVVAVRGSSITSQRTGG
jgi:O-antigen/teichoic acid export membrane protein